MIRSPYLHFGVWAFTFALVVSVAFSTGRVEHPPARFVFVTVSASAVFGLVMSRIMPRVIPG